MYQKKKYKFQLYLLYCICHALLILFKMKFKYYIVCSPIFIRRGGEGHNRHGSKQISFIASSYPHEANLRAIFNLDSYSLPLFPRENYEFELVHLFNESQRIGSMNCNCTLLESHASIRLDSKDHLSLNKY